MDDPIKLIMSLIIIFVAIAIHEYAHAKIADAAGDPTPGSFGRVTLNPFAHFDPIGAVLIVVSSILGYGIGWGKPVPMDPRKMKNPKWDHFWAVLGGPLSNLLQAVVFAILFRVIFLTSPATSGIESLPQFALLFCSLGVLINVSLLIFNLIPLGPLDGMWIVGTFLPERIRYRWTRWNLSVGQFVFLLIIFFPSIYRTVLGPPILAVSRLLGVPL